MNPRNGNYGRRLGRLVRLPRAARAVARGRPVRGPGARGPVDGIVSARQRVAVVTGGGGGIGAAIAEELGRGGWFVVTVDPLVTLDGSEQLPEPEETTAGRIVAAGGSARASSVSVTDGEAVRGAVPGAGRRARRARRRRQRRRHHPADLLRPGHRGGLAGGARRAPRGLPQRARRRPAAHGRRRARPHPRRHLRVGMAGRRCRRLQLRQAGRGRPHLAAGPTGAAGRDRQRHVAHRRHPDGGRRPRAGARERPGRSGGGGISLDSMPGPEDLGPLGAYLVGDGVRVVQRPGALRRRLGGGGRRRAPAPRGGAQRRGGLPRRGARGRRPPRLRHGRDQPGERRRRQPPVRADLRRAGPGRALLGGRRAILCRRHRPPRSGRLAHRRARGPVDHLPPARRRPTASTAPPRPCAPWSTRPGRSTPSSSPGRAIAAGRLPHPTAVGAGAGRAPRDRRAHPHRRRMGPGGRRLRRGDRPPGPAGDPHRRHHPGAAAGPRPRPSSPGRAAGGTRGGSPPSRRASRRPRRGRADRPASSSPTCSATPRPPLWPAPSWWSGPAGSACAAHPRPIGSITYGGPAVPEWLDATLREIVGATGPRHPPAEAR